MNAPMLFGIALIITGVWRALGFDYVLIVGGVLMVCFAFLCEIDRREKLKRLHGPKDDV